MSYGYLPTNSSRMFRASLITNPDILLSLINDACTEIPVDSCDIVYKDLAQKVSTDEFFYLNQMEDLYDSTLSAEDFKKRFSGEAIWLNKTAYDGIKSYLKSWVGNATTNALSPEKFTNLNANRGGVILERENILRLSRIDKSFALESGFIARAAFYKNGTYHVEGLVDNINTHNGVRHINLLEYDREISQQSFATFIAFIWVSLLFIFTLLSWLIPARYPKSSSANKVVNNKHSPINQ